MGAQVTGGLSSSLSDSVLPDRLLPDCALPDRPLTDTAGRVGPNAVLQLAAALRTLAGEAATVEVFAAAGLSVLLAHPPTTMVSERVVAALFKSLFTRLSPETARAAAKEAGDRTARYLLANRIPRPIRALLHALPPAFALRLTLAAIRKNAWTFAGSGTVRVKAGRAAQIVIAGNPIASPDCIWHVAVFSGLLRDLVSPQMRVVHTACCHDGGPECRFDITGPGARSEQPNRSRGGG